MNLLKFKCVLASFACCALLSFSQVVLASEQTIDEANRLDAEVMKLYDQGRHKEAISPAKQSLKIIEYIYGNGHYLVAIHLNKLGQLHENTGSYVDAKKYYENALAITEQTFGPDHTHVAVSLNNLAGLLTSQGQYNRAEQFYSRSLAIWEMALGEDSPQLATTLNNFAELHRLKSQYDVAERLYRRSLDILEKSFGSNHPDIALSLNGLAGVYQSKGRHMLAEPLLIRAITIWESTLGANSPNIATALNNLAGSYDALGQYTKAEPLYKKSLEIREKSFGQTHPTIAFSLNNLANLYLKNGDFAKAEPLFKNSLEIMDRVYGPTHPNVAVSLNNLGLLYDSIGKDEEAESYYKRSFEIRRNILGPNHPDVAITLNNLAELYRKQGQYAKAEPLYKQSAEISQKAFGHNHPEVATSLNNQALLLQDAGRFSESEQLYKRSLSVWEESLGIDHPSVAISLSNLAEFYRIRAQFTKAVPLLERALSINERQLGANNSTAAMITGNLAFAYASSNELEKAHTLFLKSASIQEVTREIVFQLLSEKQKTNYLSQQEGTIHAFITHTAQSMASSQNALVDTLNTWLRWKGAVAEAQGRYQEAVGRSANPEIKSKFDELINIRRELGSLRLLKPEKLPFDDYRLAMDKLEKQKETLEAALSRLSKDFAVEKTAGRADVNTISTQLSKDSVYIDFAKIRPYNFKQRKRGPEKYFAFILIPQQTPLVKLIEIADAASVDNLLKDYQQEINRVKTQGIIPDQEAIKKSTKAIYNVLFGKLEQYTADKKNLFISPDGTLNLIPFEILTTTDGKRLIEKHAISYVGAGRDIVRFTDTATTGATALIIADPDYNLGLNEKQQIASELKLTNSVHGSVTRDASKLSFTPLPDTKQEADAISKVLSGSMGLNVSNYQNKRALEDMLFAGKPPKIMHLATHGYFLNAEENQISSATTTRGLVIKEKAGLGYDDFEKIENPMLRSGIALAGVNSSLKEGRDDGLVSAEKILGLRLKGTDLVVLSACETGVGDVKNGEGVFGLKRAFILSGAKSLVMSLWSVPSAETTELMTDFYELMATGKTKSD